MNKLFLTLSILCFLSTTINAQYICNFKTANGYMALERPAGRMSFPTEKNLYTFTEVADKIYDVRDTSGVLLKSGIKTFIRKPLGIIMTKDTSDKWGIFKQDLTFIIENEFDDLFFVDLKPDFNCFINKGEYWGLIDSENKILLPIIYEDIKLVNTKVAILKKNNIKFLYFFSSKKLIEIGESCVKSVTVDLFKDKCVLIRKDSTIGAYDLEGNLIVKPIYDEVECRFPNKVSNDIYFVVTKGGKKGVVDLSQKEIIPTKYDKVFRFNERSSEGFSLYVIEEEGKKYTFYNGVKSTEFFDRISLQSRTNPSEAIVFQLGKVGIYDYFKNEFIIQPKYEALRGLRPSLFYAKKEGKYGLINSDGKILLQFKYDIIPSMRPKNEYYPETYYLIKQNGLFGYTNEDFKVILEPKYHRIRGYANGLARVQKDEKWGFIDTKFNEVIKLEYEEADAFKDQKARVVKDGKEFYINKNGECVSNCE